MVTACSNSVEPSVEDIQRNALIGNWNKFENVDLFTPQGFRFQVGFRSDGKYQFITFDNNEIAGTWKYGAENSVVIVDTICPSEGNYEFSVEEGMLVLSSIDVNDDNCGRRERLAGEWIRSGTLDQ
jgi:hypothetical protein